MGKFWGSRRALAYATSFVLAAGLSEGCELNPQPTPPARAPSGPGGETATASASTGGTTEGLPPETTSGGPSVDGTATTGGIGDPDDVSASPSTSAATTATSGTGGGEWPGLGGAGGAAGAPGDPDEGESAPSVPAHHPHSTPH